MAYSETAGVILGVDGNITADHAVEMSKELADRFPGVVFAIVPGVTAAAVFPVVIDEVPIEVDDDTVQPR